MEQSDTRRPVTRTAFYLRRTTFDQAKSAYLVDLDLPDPATSFPRWIARTLTEHAQRTPADRIQQAASLGTEPSDPGPAISRSFAVPSQAITDMEAAIKADRAAGRFLSRSEFATEAMLIAIAATRRRNGGQLPPPPARLPNKPVV